MKVLILLVGLIFILGCKGSVEVTSKKEVSRICTTWKDICVGDTVFKAFQGDTLTCIVKKIVFRRNSAGELICAESLDGKQHTAGDEAYFYRKDE